MNKPATFPEKAGKLKLTVEEFLLLDDSGAFEGYSKAELLDGEIWTMNAQMARHARMKTEFAIELALVLRGKDTALRPIIEVATRISNHSLPEPDITITDYPMTDCSRLSVLRWPSKSQIRPCALTWAANCASMPKLACLNTG